MPDHEDLREGPPPRKGLDPYELAILRGGQTSAADPLAEEDAPPPLPKLRIGNFRVGPLGFVVGLLIIVFVGTSVRFGGGTRPPALAASCDRSALAISATEVRRGQPLRYTVVGPATRVVVAIDAASLSPDLTATPLPGASESQVIRPPTTLSGCKATGILGVQVPAGEHTVSVFPAEGGRPLVSKPLTVTER